MSAGRQRKFDIEDALNKAMEVFWQKGYSGTSLSDLTEAMGINKPSLYAAFGNKESLFVDALNQYVNDHGAPHCEKLFDKEAGLRVRLEAYLASIAEMISSSDLPGGCFVTSITCEAGSECLPEGAVQAVRDINNASTEKLVSFFRDEQMKGNIMSTASPAVMADHLLTLQFGLAVMARNGTERDRLKQVISHSVSCFISEYV